jgi:hypothetical protein
MMSAYPPQAQAEHDEAKEVFNILNDQLIAELPLLIDLRVRKSLNCALWIGTDAFSLP